MPVKHTQTRLVIMVTIPWYEDKDWTNPLIDHIKDAVSDIVGPDVGIVSQFVDFDNDMSFYSLEDSDE